MNVKDAFRAGLCLLFMRSIAFGGASIRIGTGALSSINCGSPAHLDNLGRYSIIFGISPRGVVDTNRVFVKGANLIASTSDFFLSGSFRIFIGRATTATDYFSAQGIFAVGRQCVAAATVNIGGAANDQVHFFVGTSTYPMREILGSLVQDGVGALTSDAADSWLFGNNSGVAAMGGDLSWLVISSGILSLAQMRNMQNDPFGMIGSTETLLALNFSDNSSTPTINDLSRYRNNCTCQGTFDSTVGAPIFAGGSGH